ncbi:podoplanin isoform X2 [Solea solea]|uniref:podoplanin isoform X2 n=1 Tax=Solea solea TaxID=90069 RepID=UPI0027295564|nr:podoplanin isoform X2 [Solea solea]
MNVQLLLLLALAGPFCAFTHASPTEIPAELQTPFTKIDHVEEKSEATGADFTVITGPPPTLPGVAPVEATTLALLEETTIVMKDNTEEPVSGTETVTAAAEVAEPLTSDAPVKETTAPPEETQTEDHTVAIKVTTAPEIQPEVTEAPEGQAEVTAAAEVQPEVTEAPEVQPELTEATNAEMGQDEEVVVESEPDENPTSGQVVGIVIGALLAVVIVIAVVIVVVRRMGKYTP